MFIWATIAKHAKYARLSRILCVFLIVQCVLSIPVAVVLLRDPPAVMYPRLHGGPMFEYFDRNWNDYIEVVPDEIGFVEEILFVGSGPILLRADYGFSHHVLLAPSYEYVANITDVDAHFLLAITPQYIFYRDETSMLMIPTEALPAWVIEDAYIEEIFNHLALGNRYFSGIIAPVFVMIFVVFLVMQVFIYGASVWLFGSWQKLSGNMTIKERFAVCTFASVPAVIVGLAFGLFLPIVHLFIFQLAMIYVTYKAMKEYFNA